MRKRILKIVAAIAALLVLIVIGLGLWARAQLAGSLPQLDGELKAPELVAEVVVERDALGVPTLRAANRIDLALATGFIHAQDRYFQMDLLRRNSAGELSEIIGPAVLEGDKRVRVHRFREVARRMLLSGTDDDRALIEAYAKGVNAGLASLRKKPFEYMLLGEEPRPWLPEDSGLVMFSMYLDLQGRDYRDEASLGLMHDLLAPEIFDFIAQRGTSWDAPIQGEAFAAVPIPGPEVFDTRQEDAVDRKLLIEPGTTNIIDDFRLGSNNWAVAGTQTKDGRALVANDMHLGIRVPHIWYRASFVLPEPEQGGEPASEAGRRGETPAEPTKAAKERRITGVTLPGTPAMIVGSNGHVAWGFTNSEGDWVDVVIVDLVAGDKEAYQTPDGPKAFEHHEETIKVKGRPDEKLEIVSTIWGPIFDHDHQGRPRALRWVAHDAEGVNMRLMRMENVDTLEAALDVANQSGSPHQNFVVGDDRGRIAWTILGRIPRRKHDGRLPASWADGSHGWDGYLKPEEYPRVIDPENGRIWTANARVVSGEMLARLGDGGYDLGARAMQIRDDLLATDKASEADMLRIQLDDRAMFLERWQKLLLETLTAEAVDADPRRGQLREFVENWGGHAAIDSVGFRAVRTFRFKLVAQISDVLINPCKKVSKNFNVLRHGRTEGPVWQLLTERPAHLLDPRFESWDALLLAAADSVLADAGNFGGKLAEFTWGQMNTTKIQHPLSLAVPQLARWLDMPEQPLSGDSNNMPRIQTSNSGASERMGVSPGREADGYLHMPCGQSGHPLSPHYADAHEAWVKGTPTPFLPGPPVHKLALKPAP